MTDARLRGMTQPVTAGCVSQLGIGLCSTEMFGGKTDTLYNICNHQLVACERAVIRE